MNARSYGPMRRPAFWGVALVALLLAGAMFASHMSSDKSKGADGARKPAAEAVATAKTAPAADQAGAQAPAAGEPAVAGDGMRAYKDPATGQLIEPTREQAAELSAKLKSDADARRRALRSVAPAAAVTLPDGTDTAFVGEDTMVYTVATKGPDGKVSIEHATGKAAADAKVKEGATKPQQKENRDDR